MTTGGLRPAPLDTRPRCCSANRELGFVRAAELNVDGYAETWFATVLDASGRAHRLDVTNCPACGRHLGGIECGTERY